MRLHELEQRFVLAVRGELAPTELEATFVSRGQLDAQRRLRIYQYAFWTRQERVLQETFPRLRALLGDHSFGRLALAYLQVAPSRRPAIEWIGERLPELATDLPPHLRDLARLEWARFSALLAPASQTVVTVQALAGVDFPSASAELAESVTVFQILDRALCEFHERAEQPRTAEARLVPCVVWRKNQRALHRSLDAREYEALGAVDAGRPFAEVCGLFPDAQVAAACVGRWLRDGLLVSLRQADSARSPHPSAGESPCG